MPAIIAHIFNYIAELMIPIEYQVNRQKQKFKTHPVTYKLK